MSAYAPHLLLLTQPRVPVSLGKDRGELQPSEQQPEVEWQCWREMLETWLNPGWI